MNNAARCYCSREGPALASPPPLASWNGRGYIQKPLALLHVVLLPASGTKYISTHPRSSLVCFCRFGRVDCVVVSADAHTSAHVHMLMHVQAAAIVHVSTTSQGGDAPSVFKGRTPIRSVP